MTVMNAGKGTRYRLEGLLLTSKRGPVLQIDDGGAWALELDSNAGELLGRRVRVEGMRSGFDRIEVDWIDAVSG